uniref:Uncharacterized protein n=1 Tax=Moorena producens (strain JHB) TaxID=1454205 RepID=A0A1D9FYH4_MOOP1
MANLEQGFRRESGPTPNPSQEGNGSRELGVGSWELGVGSWELGVGSRESGAFLFPLGSWLLALAYSQFPVPGSAVPLIFRTLN